MEDLNWIKSKITYFLIKNYGYTRCKLTPKIQEIAESQNGSELNNLFTDIQLILSIPIEFIPEDVYIFIGEILDVLDNNKNEINNKYLKNIVVLLDDIPDFEERFTKILKNYNKDNVLIIFTNIIGEIEKEIFEKKKDAVMAQLSQSGQLSKSLPPKSNQNTIQKHKKTSLFKSLGKSNSTSRKHNYEHNQQLEVKDLIKDDKSSLFKSLPAMNQNLKPQKQQHNSLFLSKKFNTNYNVQETEEKEIKRISENKQESKQTKKSLFSKSLPTIKQTTKQLDKPKNLFTSLRKTSTNPLGSSNGIGQSKISTISLQNNPESQQIQLMTKIKQEKKEEKEEDEKKEIKEEKEMKEEETQTKKQKQKSECDITIIQNQQLNEESGNLEGANNGFEVIVDNVEQLNKSPELV